MTQTQAILSGALLIAITVFLTNGIHPAKALQYGPFVISPHSNTAANAGVFRLDTVSGEISYCFVTGTAGVDIVCSKVIR